jgi:Bacterial Ig-like domain
MSHAIIGTRFLRTVLAALAGASLTACGGGGGGSSASPTPPVLSNLNYSPTDTAQTQSGTFAVQGTVNFTDAGGDLKSLEVVVSDPNGKQVSDDSTPVQGASGQTSGTIQGSVTVPTSTAGTFTFKLTATDAAGSVSNALTGTFRVVAASNLAAVVTPTGQSPQSLIAAGGSLYWSEVGDNPVRRVPLAGGTAQSLAPRVRNPTSAAFAGADLIWLDARSDNGAPCSGVDPRIKRVLNRTTSAGVTQNLATDWACGMQFTSADLLVLNGTVYWVISTTNTYQVRATPLAGGPTTTIAATGPPIVALASANGAIYWMENVPGIAQAAIRSVPAGGGQTATIASGFASNTNSFAVDATAVYYSVAGLGQNADTLLAQPLAGGSPVTLASSIMSPMTLATDGNLVVWTDSIGAPPIISSHVHAVPVTGGAVTTLAAFNALPVDLLLTGGNALWSSQMGTGSPTPDAISSVPLAGGATTTVYQGSDAPRRLFLDATATVCWTNGNPGGLADGFGRIARLSSPTAGQTLAGGISNDAPTLFVTATDVLVADGYRIKRVPLAGGVVDTVAVEADQSPVESLVSDGTNVYWDVGAAAHAAPLSGGAIAVLTQGPAGFNRGGQMRLAANNNLYWWGTDNTNNEVLSVPAGGGSLTVLAQGLPNLSALAVDGTAVYVGSAETGAIISVPFAGGPSGGIANSGSFPNYGLNVLEVDGGNIYWVDVNHIARVPVTGGNPYPVVDFVPAMNTFGLPVIAFDATNLYWTEPLLQDIRAAAKP